MKRPNTVQSSSGSVNGPPTSCWSSDVCDRSEDAPLPIFLTIGEVVNRYRGQITDGTLRNWRMKGIGPSYVKVGKSILYRVTELEGWERNNAVKCTRGDG
jgi:hypothetical protein